VFGLVSDNYIHNAGSCAISSNDHEQFAILGFNTNTLVTDNTLDGNGLVFETFYGTCTAGGPLACSPQQAFIAQGCAIFSHNSIRDYTGRPYQYNSNNSACGWTMNDNLLLGADYNDLAAHGEFFEYASTATFPAAGATGQTEGFNVILDPTNHNGGGESAIPLQFSNAPVPTLDQHNNFYVPGFQGAQTFGVTGTGHVSGSSYTVDSLGSFTFTGGIVGNTLTASTIPGGPMRVGMNLLATTGGVTAATITAGPLTGNGAAGSTSTISGPAQSIAPGTTITAQQTLGQQQEIVCGTAGNELAIANVYTGSTGTFSAGVGGGGWGGVGSVWPMDTNGPAQITGFIDDGSGGGSPSGISGDILTVTVDDSMNLLSPEGVNVIRTVSVGVTQTFAVASAVGGATGGVGQYNLTGSALPLTIASQVLGAAPVNIWRGGWSIPPGSTLSCASQSFSAVPFERALTDETNGNPIGQVTHAQNYIDAQVYEAGAVIWQQRTGLTNSFTGTIDTSGNLTVSGLYGRRYRCTASCSGSHWCGSGLADSHSQWFWEQLGCSPRPRLAYWP
jgi:hypothetical protein